MGMRSVIFRPHPQGDTAETGSSTEVIKASHFGHQGF
jgi:hypothetical protein